MDCASRWEVTSIDTTAGETRWKMLANDSGAPGGGEKMLLVEARVSGRKWPPKTSVGVQRTPAPARAAAVTPAAATPIRKPVLMDAIVALIPVAIMSRLSQQPKSPATRI